MVVLQVDGSFEGLSAYVVVICMEFRFGQRGHAKELFTR